MTVKAIDADRIKTVIAKASDAIKSEVGDNAWAGGRFSEAADILAELALSDTFEEFLTLPAYQKIQSR
jgi:malate synthase